MTPLLGHWPLYSVCPSGWRGRGGCGRGAVVFVFYVDPSAWTFQAFLDPALAPRPDHVPASLFTPLAPRAATLFRAASFSNLFPLMKVIDKIKAKAKAKAPFFSFEFFPPKTDEGLRNLFSRVERLAGLSPVFIDVTWDASKPASNDKTLLICKVAQQYFGVDAMMHICLTSMTKAELRSVLTRAKEAG